MISLLLGFPDRQTACRREREGGRETPTEFRQETVGKIVDRRSIDIKAASCNNSLICDQLIQSRGGKRYQSRVNSQGAAWIKLHSISLRHTAHPRMGGGCGRRPPRCRPPAPRRDAEQPRNSRGASAGHRHPLRQPGEGGGHTDGCSKHFLEVAFQSAHVKSRSVRKEVRVLASGEAGRGQAGGGGISRFSNF